MEYRNIKLEDAAGNALIGLPIYVYRPDTTQEAEIFNYASVALSQPIYTDARGIVSFRAENGDVDLFIVRNGQSERWRSFTFYDPVDDPGLQTVSDLKTPEPTIAGHVVLRDQEGEGLLSFTRDGANFRFSAPALRLINRPGWGRQLLVYDGFGQSNEAEVPVGTPYMTGRYAPPNVLALNDGFGPHSFGVDANGIVVPVMDPFRFIKASDMDAETVALGAIQSIGVPAAVRIAEMMRGELRDVLVMNNAVGGQGWIGDPSVEAYVDDKRVEWGLHLDEAGGDFSQVFINHVARVNAMRSIAASDGYDDVSLNMFITHMEEDQELSAATYATQALAFMSDFEAQTSTDVTYWYHQAGGNAGTGGNDWAPRLSIPTIIAGNSRVKYLGAGYDATLYDSVHVDVRTRVLWGEYRGLAMTAAERGQTWGVAQPISASITTGTSGGRFYVDIPFTSPTRVILDDAYPNPVGPTVRGFQVFGHDNSVTLEEVEMIGSRTVRVWFDAEPTGAGRVIRYAYRNRDGSETGETGYCIGGGHLREIWETPSILLPGEKIVRRVPGFVEAF